MIPLRRLCWLLAFAGALYGASVSACGGEYRQASAAAAQETTPNPDESFKHFKPHTEADHPQNAGFQKVDIPTGVTLPEGFTFSAHYKWRKSGFSKSWVHELQVSADGKVVGFIRFLPHSDQLALDLREVVPKYQQKGLGKALILGMLEVAGGKPAKIETMMEHTNYDLLAKGLEAGQTPEQAVAGTPTGKTLLAAGYVVDSVIPDHDTLKKFPANFEGRDNRYLLNDSGNDYSAALAEPCVRFKRADVP
jgi:hypothetical protein